MALPGGTENQGLALTDSINIHQPEKAQPAEWNTVNILRGSDTPTLLQPNHNSAAKHLFNGLGIDYPDGQKPAGAVNDTSLGAVTQAVSAVKHDVGHVGKAAAHGVANAVEHHLDTINKIAFMPLAAADAVSGTHTIKAVGQVEIGAANEVIHHPGEILKDMAIGAGITALTVATGGGFEVGLAIGAGAMAAGELIKNKTAVAQTASAEVHDLRLIATDLLTNPGNLGHDLAHTNKDVANVDTIIATGVINNGKAFVNAVKTWGTDLSTVAGTGNHSQQDEVAAEQGLQQLGALGAESTAGLVGGTAGAAGAESAMGRFSLSPVLGPKAAPAEATPVDGNKPQAPKGSDEQARSNSVQKSKENQELSADQFERIEAKKENEFGKLFTPEQKQQIDQMRKTQFSKPVTELSEREVKDISHRLYGNGAEIKEKRLDLVIGPPGSGKSSIIVEPLSQEHGSLVVDSDHVKPEIRGFDGGLGTDAVHDASTVVASDMLHTALQNGDNIVIPKVGVYPSDIEPLIGAAKQMGYEVHLHLADIPKEVSTLRTFERAFRSDGSIGQWADPQFSYSVVGDKPRSTFDHLISRPGLIDGYRHYDTNVSYGTPPILIRSKNESV